MTMPPLLPSTTAEHGAVCILAVVGRHVRGALRCRPGHLVRHPGGRGAAPRLHRRALRRLPLGHHRRARAALSPGALAGAHRRGARDARRPGGGRGLAGAAGHRSDAGAHLGAAPDAHQYPERDRALGARVSRAAEHRARGSVLRAGGPPDRGCRELPPRIDPAVRHRRGQAVRRGRERRGDGALPRTPASPVSRRHPVARLAEAPSRRRPDPRRRGSHAAGLGRGPVARHDGARHPDRARAVGPGRPLLACLWHLHRSRGRGAVLRDAGVDAPARLVRRGHGRLAARARGDGAGGRGARDRGERGGAAYHAAAGVAAPGPHDRERADHGDADRRCGPRGRGARARRDDGGRAPCRTGPDLRRPRAVRARRAPHHVRVPHAQDPDGGLMPARNTQRFLILADGQFEPMTSKTANCCIRYMPERIVGVLDRAHPGITVQQVMGVGGSLPVVGDFERGLGLGATAVLIGIAPMGGRLPAEWRGWLRTALERGLEIWSGLHTFIGDDPELGALARERRVRIFDAGKPPATPPVADGLAAEVDAYVVHTVGSDCNVGKMTAQVELRNALLKRGHRTRFVATGQTGIFIEGWGIAVDAVVADFIAGASEWLVLEAAKDADIILVEGQGSLIHPGYSGVTLALLHGCCPDALILCHQATRDYIGDYDGRAPWVKIPTLPDLVEIYERAAAPVHPTKVIGICLNTFDMSEAQAREAVARAAEATGLPATDPVRFASAPLVDAIVRDAPARRVDARRSAAPARAARALTLLEAAPTFQPHR